ncbi:MAG: DNA repair protein RadC, partial [Alphaproteobacteria bacterium]
MNAADDRERPAPAAGHRAAEKHHAGHRERLRRRFLTVGPDSLADYELLELLLFAGLPRRDVKPLAKRLLEDFGSLGGVLTADPAQLERRAGLRPATVATLKAVAAAAQRMLREEAAARPVIGAWSQLLDYLSVAMKYERAEQFRLLFLDRRNLLIADEVQQRGTVDHAPVYPREVVKRALELGATALILVHNHPSGDPTPSRDDIAMTRTVAEALNAVNVALHDHVIIGRQGHASFR